jgi:hypothetical protein
VSQEGKQTVAYSSSTLKMEPVHSSETAINFHQITLLHLSENSIVRGHFLENLKCSM